MTHQEQAPAGDPTTVLAAIQARAEAATEGPWRWAYPGSDSPALVGVAGDEDYNYEVEVLEAEHDGGCACRKACTLTVSVNESNAEFIAHSRTDVPRLVKALQDVLAEHSSPYGDCCPTCTDENDNPLAKPCPTVRVIAAALGRDIGDMAHLCRTPKESRPRPKLEAEIPHA